MAISQRMEAQRLERRTSRGRCVACPWTSCRSGEANRGRGVFESRAGAGRGV